MDPRVGRRLRLFLVCLFARRALSYPDAGLLTGLSPLRSDDQHPFDLFNTHLLQNAPSNENPDFSIGVNSTAVDGRRPEWVTVSWSGVRNPHRHDMVVMYSVGDDQSETLIKSRYAAEANDHLEDGSGSLEVMLLNHRTDVKFVFVTQFLWMRPRWLGESEVIIVENKDAPLYVHLALTGRPNEMSVQWVSATDKRASVQWGMESGNYENEARAESTTYTPDDLCGSPATDKGYIFPGYMHSATMSGLIPGVKYYYIFGNHEGGYSEEHSFVTPPETGSKDTVKIVAIGDMGQYNIDYFDNPEGYEASLATSANINAEEDVDLVMHVGDISYAQGYIADWDVFFDQLHPLTSKVPYMTVPGNHERLYPFSGDRYDTGTDSGGECGVAYDRRLKMPVPGEDMPWYSFDFGPIHFTTFSTEHPFEPGTEQYKFLEKDLASVNREITPWLIVCFHRPMFPGITPDLPPRGHWYVGQELQKILQELFYTNKVDMLWSGHHHSYQRTCPVHNKQCTELDAETKEAQAPVQLIFGHAGAQLYTNLVKEDFIEFQVADFGYVRVMVNATQLTTEAIRNSDRAVIDTVTLYKSTSGKLTT